MSSSETYIAFAAIMLVIALLAVAIDWFGKPLRHRKFVPKIYRFPDERVPRRAPQRLTPWSDAALVLPVTEGTLEPARPVAGPDAAAFAEAPIAPPLGPPIEAPALPSVGLTSGDGDSAPPPGVDADGEPISVGADEPQVS